MPEPRDLIIQPMQYILVRSDTGTISTLTGPSSLTISDKETLVRWDHEQGKFIAVPSTEGLQQFVIAARGQYILLRNPAKDRSHPTEGKKNDSVPLSLGDIEVIQGPASFALFPGQSAVVIGSHRMRQNQYLVIEITDATAATANWPQGSSAPWVLSSDVVTEELEADQLPQPDSEPVTGRQYIITGTQWSVFAPVTGVVVVEDEKNHYVREALVLADLEWCILKSASGVDRYVQGPAVVFPATPDEVFVTINGNKIFAALELTRTTGVHLKAIVAHTDTRGTVWAEGQERFITGEDVPFFFPSPEIVIVTYGDSAILYAITIPAKSARYMLDKLTGKVELVEGPRSHLPNPTTEVYVRRILSDKQCMLWFPGNEEVLAFNRGLRSGAIGSNKVGQGEPRVQGALALAKLITADVKHTPPRHVTLEDSTEGAVTIEVWDGYAVCVNTADGPEVVLGPAIRHLQYHEDLVPFFVSKGTPKNTKEDYPQVYLRIKGNTVSDEIVVSTSDYVAIKVNLTYTVTFDEAQSSKWWGAGNYVAIVAQNMSSEIQQHVRKLTMEQFYADPMPEIVKAILGESGVYEFVEFGFSVVGVKVASVKINDVTLERRIQEAQQLGVQNTLTLNKAVQDKEHVAKIEEINRAIAEQKAITSEAMHQLALAEIQRNATLNEAKTAAEKANQEAIQQLLDLIGEANRNRLAADSQSDIAIRTARAQLEQQALEAQTAAVIARYGAITPGQYAQLQRMADEGLLATLAEKFGGSAQLAGVPIMEYIGALLKGTGLEQFGNLFKMPGINSDTNNE